MLNEPAAFPVESLETIRRANSRGRSFEADAGSSREFGEITIRVYGRGRS
jgi:hypothetical protein